MRELPFDGEFDAAFNAYTAWGYFEDDAENLRALKAFRRALKLGGRFLFDFVNVYGISRRAPRVWEASDDGIVILRESRIDYRRGIAWETDRIIEPGKAPRETTTFGVRMYTVDVLCAMFERAGFCVDRIVGDWDESDFSFESPRVIFSCAAV